MGTTGSRPGGVAARRRDSLDQGAKSGRLVLASCDLVAVPPEVWLLATKLRSLDLSSNKLAELPSQIGTLASLQALKVSFNALEQLPAELVHLDNLKTLEADHNALHTVAAVLPRKNLRMLDLSFNRLQGNVGHPSLAIPPSVTMCNLSNNGITGFSPSFGFEMLVQLVELDVDNNRVEAVPVAVQNCVRLTTLKARNNCIATLPAELFAATSVNRIHLEGNPYVCLFVALTRWCFPCCAR